MFQTTNQLGYGSQFGTPICHWMVNTIFIDIYSICGPQGHGLTHNQLHQRRGVGAPTFDDATELELLLCPRVRMS